MKKNKIIISITGLGYVGLQVGLAFAKKFHTIGYDTNNKRIENLRSCIDNTKEVSANELRNSKITFTSKINSLKKANFHIIAVPTPINTIKNPDLNLITSATINIAKIIKNGDIVVYESTVYPGLTEEICIPILERKSGMISNKDFFVGYSPERINPGDKINNYKKINKIVSAQNKNTLNLIKNVYQKTTKGNIIKVNSIKIAEAAKVIENTQRDINIALINEFSQIFNKMKINTYDVLSAASTKWNFLNFEPGLVGGHCIGVDPYYLTYKSKKIGINPKLILSGRKINDGMPSYIGMQILNNFKKKNNLKINIMGLTFKENCPDIRNSKVLDIANFFIKKNHKVNLYDPYVHEVKINNLPRIKVKPIKEIKKADVLIIAVIHDEYLKLTKDFFAKQIIKNGLIFDVKGKFKKLNIRNKNYEYMSL